MTGRSGPREPRRNENPRQEARSKVVSLFRQITDILRYLPVLTYFLYWDRKELIRYRLRVGALSVLSFSLLLLWAEVAAELAGAQSLIRLLNRLELRWPVVILFSIAVFLLLIHHAVERRHELPHYLLGQKVWEFFEARPYASEGAVVSQALRYFHAIFKPCGISHVSLFRPNGEGLTIRDDEVYPVITERWFFVALQPGQGVAGLVYDDLKPRYVPRLFFPMNNDASRFSVAFPHSMKFEIVPSEGGGLALKNPDMDLYVFKQPPEGRVTYRSFLSVPLKCTQSESAQECLGVLNFDFERTDPLTKLDIQSAAFLGALLGDEIARARGITSGANGAA